MELRESVRKTTFLRMAFNSNGFQISKSAYFMSYLNHNLPHHSCPITLSCQKMLKVLYLFSQMFSFAAVQYFFTWVTAIL